MNTRHPSRRNTTAHLLATIGLILAAGCAGNGKAGDNKDAVSSTSAPGSPPGSKILAQEAEIIEIEDMPKVAVTGGKDVPSDPKALKENALTELAAGNNDDALSMIDVLLVLNPEDAELIEIRSDILTKQGLVEDAAVDRDRCCKLGRKTCCP